MRLVGNDGGDGVEKVLVVVAAAAGNRLYDRDEWDEWESESR